MATGCVTKCAYRRGAVPGRRPTVVQMGSPAPTATLSRWQKLKRHFRDAFSEQFEYQRREGELPSDARVAGKRGRDAYRYILLLLLLLYLSLSTLLHMLLLPFLLQ